MLAHTTLDVVFDARAPEKQTANEPFDSIDAREISAMCAATAAESNDTLSVTVTDGLPFPLCDIGLAIPW